VTATLRTERLLLTPYVRADEERFVRLFGDERVSRWMGDGPASEAEYRAMFERLFAMVYAENRFDVWAVWQGDRYVGHAEIKPTATVEGHEIIYALAREAWGRGLGAELAEAVVAYGFDTLGLTDVHATVAAPNTVSLVLLDRIGFVHVRDIDEDDGATTRVLTRHRPGELTLGATL
jgi:RimJ/RimL family protein N-acetyltransferase